jgi:hypothetical protein
MKWFRENRWLGTFLIVFGVCALLALYFFFTAKGAFAEACARFNEASAERNRLEHLNPFPNEVNYRQMKTHLEDYQAALEKLKAELKTQMLPVAPLAPNEFQARLRRVMNQTMERARSNRVKLPVNFRLGFDEYTAALPDTTAAPLLGQELAQIELLTNIVIDARVDAITGFKRSRLSAERPTAAASPTPAPGRKPAAQTAAGPEMLDRGVVDFSFTSSPAAARKILNQIASTTQQFFIVRTLHVRNEQEKPPPREAAQATPGAKPATTGPALKFIVGNEHIETSARIEIIRFTF